jgi:hypothetical protein
LAESIQTHFVIGKKRLKSSTRSVRHHPVPPHYPPFDFDRAYRVCNEGIPLAGIFECSVSSTWNRERYDNHSTLAPEYDAVREKLRVEEKNSFYILLPCFLCYFLFGLHLSPLSFNWRKGKGRACVDNSSWIGKEDDGAPNDSIPAPSSAGHDDECPAVHYASALQRHLVWIWNLQISHPSIDILQFGDDVHVAFHQMLYSWIFFVFRWVRSSASGIPLRGGVSSRKCALTLPHVVIFPTPRLFSPTVCDSSCLLRPERNRSASQPHQIDVTWVSLISNWIAIINQCLWTIAH